MSVITRSCAAFGDAICDGFQGSHIDDEPTRGVQEWHDELHDIQIKRIVREGLRPLVGALVDA